MPDPLSARQQARAAKRLEMENDPQLKAWQDKISADVLSGSGGGPNKPADEVVKPRQMLPNFYARGGPVKFARGGSPKYGNDYRKK
jgi:hypothetical protein